VSKRTVHTTARKLSSLAPVTLSKIPPIFPTKTNPYTDPLACIRPKHKFSLGGPRCTIPDLQYLQSWYRPYTDCLTQNRMDWICSCRRTLWSRSDTIKNQHSMFSEPFANIKSTSRLVQTETALMLNSVINGQSQCVHTAHRSV